VVYDVSKGRLYLIGTIPDPLHDAVVTSEALRCYGTLLLLCMLCMLPRHVFTRRVLPSAVAVSCCCRHVLACCCGLPGRHLPLRRCRAHNSPKHVRMAATQLLQIPCC